MQVASLLSLCSGHVQTASTCVIWFKLFCTNQVIGLEDGPQFDR